MKKKTYAEINRQPRQIKECRRPSARKKTSYIVKITKRLQTVTIAARLQWKADKRIVNARTQCLVEMRPDSHIDTASNHLKGALKDIKSRRKQRESDQCWHALAWKDSIIDLQHKK